MGPNMPVSCESDSAISSTIRDSLVNYNSITKPSNLALTKVQLGSALKQSLLKPIEYVEAPPGFGYTVQDTLKAKYTILRPSEEDKSTSLSILGSTSTIKPVNGTKSGGACLPSPKNVLFSREKVQIGWGNATKWNVGSGMVNLGNTCYLNSTLQALFHVPSFANWLLVSEVDHRVRCEEINGSQNGCLICSLAAVLLSTQSSMYPIKPTPIYSKLKQICRHFIHGHQEDAHEFLRYLMESAEKSYLLRYKNSKDFEQYTKETTPINQILGGYLRTSVKCLSCQYESVTFQHFEDLLLDIRKVNTIEDALRNHFARERLEDMDYSCESCKKKVSATKQFSLERAPIALCIQLKRFSGINGKISKQIHIAHEIDFSQYSSREMKNSQLKYRLVSMITHLGSTPQCGHYTAIGCAPDGSYYQFDDSSVRPMSMNSMLNTNPYIIFYELIASKQSTMLSNNENNIKRTETSTQFIGPLLPTSSNQQTKPVMHNGLVKRVYGPASNGFNDNRKVVTLTSTHTTLPKKFTDTKPLAALPAVVTTSSTSGNAPSETSTNNLEKNSSKLVNNSYSDSSSMPVRETPLPMPQVKPESPTKRNVEKVNKTSSELVTKNLEDNRNSEDSDSESEILSAHRTPALPSMPQLKSPTIQKIDEKIKTPNGVHTVVKEDIRNGVKRTSEFPSDSAPLPNSSSDKQLSPIIQKKDDINKSYSPKPSPDLRECLESPQKTLSLVPIKSSIRTTPNPFSRCINNTNGSKIVKPKTNGYNSHNATSYDQRSPCSKSTNSYVPTARRSLVPYTCNDDSDNNEDRKSPPIVKTKAGPFQVTKSPMNGNNSHWNSNEHRFSWSNSNMSNAGGRVPSLNTWNGGSSFLENEIAADQRDHHKRKLEKDFDSDLDHGRMKKRRRLSINHRDNPNYNAFQEQQNQQHQQHQRYRRQGYNNGQFFNQSHRFQQKFYTKRKY